MGVRKGGRVMEKGNDSPGWPAGGQAGKRMMDMVIAAVGLALFAPMAPLVMLAIVIESPASPIFAQTRMGRHGRPFTIYKFRTMHPDTPWVATHEMRPGNVLRVGRILRKFKIDEVPQLVNVLLGQMSLVGPRPCLLTQKELIAARRRAGVFEVLPGITGLAQVNGIDMSEPERLARWDADYIATRSLWLDLRILLQTAGVAIAPREAR